MLNVNHSTGAIEINDGEYNAVSIKPSLSIQRGRKVFQLEISNPAKKIVVDIPSDDVGSFINNLSLAWAELTSKARTE